MWWLLSFGGWEESVYWVGCIYIVGIFLSLDSRFVLPLLYLPWPVLSLSFCVLGVGAFAGLAVVKQHHLFLFLLFCHRECHPLLDSPPRVLCFVWLPFFFEALAFWFFCWRITI